MTAIIGAGLSGLIAATLFPLASVHEARSRDQVAHKALLRFRSDALSRLTGIPFRKVLVRKSLWDAGEHVAPTIARANTYSRKTNGKLLDRSVWNVEPVERYIAPENLIEQMVDSVGSRLHWNWPADAGLLTTRSKEHPVISTIPMPVLIDLLRANDPFEYIDAPEFSYKSILVDRYRVDGCDLHQTVYYPAPNFSAYRASITGDLLIVERSGAMLDDDLGDVLESFGLSHSDVMVLEESHKQRFGKIAPIDDQWRRQFIFDLSHNRHIYSMGRFAIWKNILLDDVVQDGAIIKRLMNSGSYGAALHNSRDTL